MSDMARMNSPVKREMPGLNCRYVRWAGMAGLSLFYAANCLIWRFLPVLPPVFTKSRNCEGEILDKG
jgi:hypothetical protein